MTRPTDEEILEAGMRFASSTKYDFLAGARWAFESEYVKGLEARVKELEDEGQCPDCGAEFATVCADCGRDK